jgi:HNH endonuclease
MERSGGAECLDGAEESKGETATEPPPYDPGPVVARTARVRNKHDKRKEWREVVIPTDAEFIRIALELQSRGVRTRTQVLGWPAIYESPSSFRWKTATSNPFDPFTREELSKPKDGRIGSRFFLFVGKKDFIQLLWSNEDQPPTRFDSVELSPEGAIVIQGVLNFDAPSWPSSLGGPPSAGPDDEPLLEGAELTVNQDGYERNPVARRKCLEHYGPQCFVCGFDFAATFGAFAAGIIHVHHVVPLSTTGEAHQVDPTRDLRPLCPNCHLAIHRHDPLLTPEEFRALLESNKV